ncbi:hypothetical protein PYV02_14800 [Leifsonia sp. H3M29-4]|uniref:hypothetical protein n=1 Tax=Salinibacterium metalliresistens TaxID=3031321 RepID=UPI0023DA9656|nr:hypothetical protein [Salinibacterium metalliresistens]MDF1480352.1 hypothetical protein [Salinibacterium metalliresistens]
MGDSPATESERAAASWTLTRQLSPRDRVRVAVLEQDSTGYSNTYSSTAPIDGDRPGGPWAMYLASRDGYLFLCFDLDAKAGNAAHDAGRLSLWLDELNIAHVVAVSGPSGGRHVWIALDEATDPQLIRELADLAGSLLASLDKSPLSNPDTGCVRPPGAPHRDGGSSTITHGSIETLQRAATTVDQLALLRAFLVDAGAAMPAAPVSIVRGMSRDEHGHPHLIGRRRDPSARIRALMNEATAADSSTTQAAVLAGLARARWRYADVAALLEHSPALEHARSRPTAGGRAAVPHNVALRRLAADWERTVYYVAANPIAGDNQDADFQARAIAVTQAVRAAESRAEAMPGLWGMDGLSRSARAARGRYSHRAVLRAVCLYLVQAARSVVEVDVRRLAQDTGYGREACRLALIALSAPEDPHDVESGWLVRVDAAEGVHGATYRLSHRFSTGAEDSKWSQAATRPSPSAGSDARTWWINQLAGSLHTLAHDTFAAPRSLGRTAGRTYAALSPDVSRSPAELTALSGISPRETRRALRRLAWYTLSSRTSSTGWNRPDDDRRDQVAQLLEVDGYLEQRAARYDVERATWAWWQAELTWMRRPHKRRRGRRAPTGVVLFDQNDRPDYPRYPSRGPGRFDHPTAAALVREGILRPAPIAADVDAA